MIAFQLPKDADIPAEVDGCIKEFKKYAEDNLGGTLVESEETLLRTFLLYSLGIRPSVTTSSG